MIESLIMAVRFPAAANSCSSSTFAHYRPFWSLEDLPASGCGCHFVCRSLFSSGSSDVPWNKIRRSNNPPILRRNHVKHKARAVAEHLGSPRDPIKQSGKSCYHPFEEILKSKSENDEDVTLTVAETSRTVIEKIVRVEFIDDPKILFEFQETPGPFAVEVNSKATLLFNDLINEEVQENVFLPDLLYVTDEFGNIYFQVKNDEDILQAFTSENSFVQVIIGFDTTELMKEMELLGLSGIEYGIEEIEDEDSDLEDDVEEDDKDDEDDGYNEDWVNVLEDEDEEDQDDSDEELGDWAKLETMRTSHPMYFAKKLAEAVSVDSIDWMDQPPAGLAIQGLLRPACVEEHSDIQKYKSVSQSPDVDKNQVDNAVELHKINGHMPELESSGESSVPSEDPGDVDHKNGISYYKLEMVKIHLITAHGHQKPVDIEDFRAAHPDAIAHTAKKIISRLKAGGEKTTQALKSLCWRCKGIHVEEAAVIGVDSLGFDLRVCSGTQVQTLRIAFNSRATSEYAAERQLNDLLFPRINHKPHKKKHAQQNEQ